MPTDPDQVELIRTPAGLGLARASPFPGDHSPPRPVVIELAFPPSARKSDPISRALGLHHAGGIPHILDATAGLLRDSLHLLALGARVSACERNPAMLSLIRDALARSASDAALDDRVRRALHDRFLLFAEDARSVLQRQRDFHAVLIDPMHPDVGRTAAVTREMRIVREVVGHDADAAALLTVAIAAAPRIVVKLPRHAPPLVSSPRITGSIKGRALRWDFYVPI